MYSHMSQQARSSQETKEELPEQEKPQNHEIDSKNTKGLNLWNLIGLISDRWMIVVYSHSNKEDKALIKSTQSILSRTLTSPLALNTN